MLCTLFPRACTEASNYFGGHLPLGRLVESLKSKSPVKMRQHIHLSEWSFLMPRYKVLKGVAHHDGHSFTSLMNYVGNDYVMRPCG
jgi:hypothetical protein